MPCFHPIEAYRQEGGYLDFRSSTREAALETVQLPCQHCLGCRAAYARNWAIRGQLELQQHRYAAWTTLTFDDQHLPPTLDKTILQRYFKRLRYHTTTSFRYLASGEYGETTNRPHYHAVLYGLDTALHGRAIQEAWGLGHTKTDKVTPARIAYTAGYTAKKIDFRDREKYILVKEGTPNAKERVHPRTGEVYWTLTTYQPPFLLTSKGGHGIGGHAKQWPNMWKDYAIHNGHKVPVPRYYHEAWKQITSTMEHEEQQYEKYHNTPRQTQQERQAAEQIAKTKQQHKQSKKHL